MQNQEPKISLVEILFILPLCVFIDVVPWLFLAVGLNDFGLISWVMLPSMQWYLRTRGAPAMFDLVCQIVELIPYVDDLPLTTVGFVGTIILDRNPRLNATMNEAVAKTGVAGKILKAASAARGGAAGVAAGAGKGVAQTAAQNTTSQGAGKVVSLQSVLQKDAVGGQGTATGGAKIVRVAGKERGEEAKQGAEISEQAFGVPKSTFEEQLEPLTELPTPETKKDPAEDQGREHLQKAA